jgi:hypothetical protein
MANPATAASTSQAEQEASHGRAVLRAVVADDVSDSLDRYAEKDEVDSATVPDGVHVLEEA